MAETLTIQEIETKYDGEWVLIEDPQTNEALEVLAGKVLYHSPNRDEFDRNVLRFHPRRAAVIYTGELPAGVEFIL